MIDELVRSWLLLLEVKRAVARERVVGIREGRRSREWVRFLAILTCSLPAFLYEDVRESSNACAFLFSDAPLTQSASANHHPTSPLSS